MRLVVVLVALVAAAEAASVEGARERREDGPGIRQRLLQTLLGLLGDKPSQGKRALPYVGKENELEKRACGGTKVTAEDQELIVKVHNEWRKKAGGGNLKKMRWNKDLASKAQQNANQCYMAHSYMTDCAGTEAGQNLCYRSDEEVDWTWAINYWHEEIEFYTYSSDRCRSGEVCTHYTQVVWAETDEVGCGIKRCYDGNTYYACNYLPKGNMGGQPFMKGGACSQCMYDTWDKGWKCEGDLCVPCSLNSPGCKNCDKPCDKPNQKSEKHCKGMHDMWQFCDRSNKYNHQAQKECNKYCCELSKGACSKRSVNKKEELLELLEEVLEE